MNIFKRKEKKPKSLKFYLCLIGVLAGVYLALVGILAIRNPKTEQADNTSSVSVSVSERSTSEESSDTKQPEKGPADQSAEPETVKGTKADHRNTEPDDYGRGKKRYTELGAQDVFTKVNVQITNQEELEGVVGVSIDTVKSYLNAYAAHNEVDASECTMLDYVYIGFLSERIEIYIQFNDADSSLVTVIYEPANSTHSSRVDVLPCQYTIKEIEKKAWQ